MGEREGVGCGALFQSPGYQPKQDIRHGPTGIGQLRPLCPSGNRAHRLRGVGREEELDGERREKEWAEISSWAQPLLTAWLLGSP